MENKDQPLYQLTVGQYIDLQRSLLNEQRATSIVNVAAEHPDLIFIESACELTGYTEKTIYTKVSRKEIPVISYGRPLTFSRKMLQQWMLNGRPSNAEAVANSHYKKLKR